MYWRMAFRAARRDVCCCRSIWKAWSFCNKIHNKDRASVGVMENGEGSQISLETFITNNSSQWKVGVNWNVPPVSWRSSSSIRCMGTVECCRSSRAHSVPWQAAARRIPLRGGCDLEESFLLHFLNIFFGNKKTVGCFVKFYGQFAFCLKTNVWTQMTE